MFPLFGNVFWTPEVWTPAARSTLEESIGKRNYTAAEELLAAEAAKNPKSQPLLLVLANVLFLDGKQLNSALVLKKAELLGRVWRAICRPDEHAESIQWSHYVMNDRLGALWPKSG